MSLEKLETQANAERPLEMPVVHLEECRRQVQ